MTTIQPESGRSSLTHAAGWAVAIVGILTVVRAAKGAGAGPWGVDASYYVQLAQHVMRGEGLVTTVSLYFEGWILPARTSIYPLWPLLLGYTGRAIGLVPAVNLLPRVLYVIDLVLLYLLARELATRLGGLRLTTRWYVPDTAHLLVAVFGLNISFFGATTHPYTEGLAFACGFGSLLALAHFERSGGALLAAVSGLLAGLAFLTRTQMVGVAIGTFLSLAFFALRDRRFRAGAAIWSIVTLATVAPFFFFIGFIPGLEGIVGSNDLPRVQLPRFAGWIEYPSTTAWIADRAASLRFMFNPASEYSYIRTFGLAALLVPLAAVVGIIKRRIHAPRSLLLTATVIAGIFFFFNLMLYHSDVWMAWLFGWRHGLPFIFLLAVATPYLVANSGRRARVAVAALLFVSILSSSRTVRGFIAAPDLQFSSAERRLLEWLNQPNDRRVVITTNAQNLGPFTDAHIHWTHCEASAETTTAIFERLQAQYVVVYEHELRCPFIAAAGMLRVVAIFGEPGRRIFVMAPFRRQP